MSATNVRPFWGSHWPQPSSRFPNRNRKTFHCVHLLFSFPMMEELSVHSLGRDWLESGNMPAVRCACVDKLS